MTARVALRLLPALLLLLAGTAQAALTRIYDPTLGTLPQSQGWLLFLRSPGSTVAPVTAPGGGMLLETASAGGSGDQAAGFFSAVPTLSGTWVNVNPGFPILDPSVGFTLGFELQIHDEDHGTNDDRGGFSVILLGADRRGLELAFWQDTLFAYDDSPLFTHGEDKEFDSTAGRVLYELTVQGDQYTVAADGAEILTGPTRDYEAFNGSIDPYENPNFLFLGDDTDSAYADFTLGSVWIDDDPFAVPLPGAAPLFAAAFGLIGFLAHRGRRATSATAR